VSRRRSNKRQRSIDAQGDAQPFRDGNLPAAERALRAAIGSLIWEQVDWINNQAVTAPSLVDQFRDAIAGKQGSGRGHSARSLPLVWVDAVDKLNGMDAELRAWERSDLPSLHIQPDNPPADVAGRVRELGGRAWRPQDVARIEQITARLTAWAADIATMLDPPRRITVPAACPVCDATTTHRRDKSGELVRVPALTIVAELGCTCAACGAHWTPDLYRHLARVLECPVPAGVLE
jgi:hypothetical protein